MSHFTLHALRTALYMLSLVEQLSNTMSLSSVRASTPIFYHRITATDRAPATIVGPSQRPSDYLRIQCEVNGKAVIHHAVALHCLGFHIRSPSPSPLTSSKPEPDGEGTP